MPEKAQFNCFMPVETALAVRVRAASTGAPVGDLVDLLLRYGLEKLSEQAVREWAQKRTERKISRVDMAAHPGLMKRDEKRVLQALEQLHASSEGAWRFGADEIADRAGVRRAAAYWALQALRTGGLVEGHEVEGAGRDRWGRPTQSIWSMISAKPQQ